MNLTLYSHPLASFCHKVLIALYENGTPFTHEIVNLGDAEASAGFRALWPMGKMPVLRDEGRGRTLPETTIILEYLDTHYPGAQPLLPKDQDRRLEARLWDRVFDSYVQVPMQKIVADVRRAPNDRDPCGVADAHATLKPAYDMLERQVAQRTWAVGEAFSIADCAAAPALFYAGVVAPFSASHPNVTAYFDRLVDRPSFRRVIDEARPYFQYFPFKESLPARFL